MQKRTAEKVVDILGLVEAMLDDGRPRKLPGKPRPEAIIWGLPAKVSLRNWYDIQKVSLVGAFKMAALEQGYSAYVRKVAAQELAWAVYDRFGQIAFLGLDELDGREPDTRQLIRDVKRARRFVERTWLK
jgi:hypothetical protein